MALNAITLEMGREMHARSMRSWVTGSGTHAVMPVEVEAPVGGGTIDDGRLLAAGLAVQPDIVAVRVHQGDVMRRGGGGDVAALLFYILLFLAIASLCAV